MINTCRKTFFIIFIMALFMNMVCGSALAGKLSKYNRDQAVGYAFDYYSKVCTDGKYYVNPNNPKYNKLVKEIKNLKASGVKISISGGIITAPSGYKITELMQDCALDCAHFVSHCLIKGGISVDIASTPSLKDKLTSGGYGTWVARSEGIAKLQPGDIVIYSGHTAFITKIAAKKVYVTSHSPSKKEVPETWFGTPQGYVHITY
jgi:hypothetical protein